MDLRFNKQWKVYFGLKAIKFNKHAILIVKNID